MERAPTQVTDGTKALRERDGGGDEIVLGVLDAVERDHAITQRSVAEELGIALGQIGRAHV